MSSGFLKVDILLVSLLLYQSKKKRFSLLTKTRLFWVILVFGKLLLPKQLIDLLRNDEPFLVADPGALQRFTIHNMPTVSCRRVNFNTFCSDTWDHIGECGKVLFPLSQLRRGTGWRVLRALVWHSNFEHQSWHCWITATEQIPLDYSNVRNCWSIQQTLTTFVPKSLINTSFAKMSSVQCRFWKQIKCDLSWFLVSCVQYTPTLLCVQACNRKNNLSHSQHVWLLTIARKFF